jgi:LPXTG-motif cell wall-anchored protein
MLTFSGLPDLQGTADAAPTVKRCDKMFGLPSNPSQPGTLPWERGETVRPKAAWDEYEFDNLRQAMDGLTLPADPVERQKFLEKIGTDYKNYKEGDPRRVYATYYNNQKFGKRPFQGTFEEWLTESYIENYARNRRGAAFEAKVVRDLGLVGPDWLCQEYIEVIDENGKKVLRKYDAVNHKTKEFVEIKSGGAHDTSQAPKDRVVLNDPKYKDYKLRFAFGGEREEATRQALDKLNKDVGNDSQGRPRVTAYEHRSTPVARYTPGPYSKYDQYMSPNPANNQGSRGGGNDMVNRSAPTPETARRQIERARAMDPGGQRVRGPGGVDFSTLELRFVGTPVKGKGVDYSFSAKKMPDPENNPGFGGKEKAQLISDSFFTWLALTPEKFWVNLNPDQPDKIMDAKLGTTDAGRVLLEADMEMKHDNARAMDPKTERGALFWDSLARVDGAPCLHSTRNWIVPEPAQVREQDGGIYILDAPLKVNSVPQEYDTPVPGGKCELSKAQIRHNQRLVNTMIIPEVEKQINNDPEYADLRRVYTSRIAAEWVRQQDAKKPTDYHKIIDSNDVSKWPIRGPKWDKMDVWKEMVKSFTEGDYSFEREYGGRVYIYTVGGVDFSTSPKRNINRPRFIAEHRYLPRTTTTSVKTMTDDAETDDTLYLGGNTNGKASGGGGGTDPTPTPTDEPTGQPSTPPASHAPQPTPSTPAGSGNTPSAKGPDGELADTGSNTPIGLIAGIAAALMAAGTGLVWLGRRRKAAEES